MSESVSVIIPVYNGERFLAEAIQSVLDQTLPPDEIIVVDDGSTDGTAAIVCSLAGASTLPIRYFHQENQGPAVARNRAIALTSAKLIAFLDADDLWHPEKLERQVADLTQKPAFCGVVCHMRSFVEPGCEWPLQRNRAILDQQPPAYLPSALLVKREALDKVGLFDPLYRTGEDTEWFFRARDSGISISVTPAVLLSRRFHSANLSHSAQASSQRMIDIIRNSVQRRRPEP